MFARGAVHNPEIFNMIKKLKISNNELNNLKLKEEEVNIVENILKNEYEEVKEEKKANKETKEKDENLINFKFKENEKTKNGNSTLINDNPNNLKESKNLAKVLEKKYGNTELNTINIVKEFILIAEKYENAFHNTKYNALYILKTHKNHQKYFNLIQKTKNYEELKKSLEIEIEKSELKQSIKI